MPNLTFRFKKIATQDEQQLVSGIAMFAVRPDGTQITDLQGDRIDPADLERSFFDYALESREGDVMHEREKVASLVEMLVVTPEKLTALFKGLGYDKDVSDYKGAAVFVTYKVHSASVWKRVKAGELKAFSIEASAEREEVAA